MLLLVLLLLLLILILLPACGAAESESAKSETRSVRVAVSLYFTNAPLYITQEEGYFAEEGLAVDFVEPPGEGTSQLIPVLANGRVDVIAGALNVGLFNAMGQGAPIRFVADKGSYVPGRCTSSGIVARRQLLERGEISGPADLANRRVAKSNSLLGDYFMDALLDTLDLSPGDIRRTTLPPVALLQALENGAVDFASATEPWLTHLRQAGHEIVIRNEEILPDFPSAILAFGPTLIEQDPETGRRFVRAYLRGVRQYNQGKTERNLAILERVTGMDRATLEQICWPSIRDDGRIDSRRVLLLQNWAQSRGWLKQIVPESGFYDSSFVAAAERAR